MATLTLTPTALHICNSASLYESGQNVWTARSMSTNYALYYGQYDSAIQQYRQRYTFNQSMTTIGNVLGFNFGNISRTNPNSVSNGNLYISSSNLAPLQATQTNMFANWSLTGTGSTLQMTISNFNLTMFLNAIGSATTWYVSLYVPHSVYYNYHWTDKSSLVRGIITHDPYTIKTNVSGSWKDGNPWTNVSGTWKQGEMWTNVSGTWKKGTV